MRLILPGIIKSAGITHMMLSAHMSEQGAESGRASSTGSLPFFVVNYEVKALV